MYPDQGGGGIPRGGGSTVVPVHYEAHDMGPWSLSNKIGHPARYRKLATVCMCVLIHNVSLPPTPKRSVTVYAVKHHRKPEACQETTWTS